MHIGLYVMDRRAGWQAATRLCDLGATAQASIR